MFNAPQSMNFWLYVSWMPASDFDLQVVGRAKAQFSLACDTNVKWCHSLLLDNWLLEMGSDCHSFPVIDQLKNWKHRNIPQNQDMEI